MVYRVYQKEYFDENLPYSLLDKGYIAKGDYFTAKTLIPGDYVIMRESQEHLDYIRTINVEKRKPIVLE